ncbi:hypothetical protein JCM10049v2_001781 [Rhodotorula toruloides]
MPSTATTSSHGPAPAPAPPPPDERMPLSSVPDLTKFFPPLIQDAICAEMSRGEEGAYYDEFEQLYWMYSGWDKVREDFERVWRPLIDEVQKYKRLLYATGNGGNMELRAEVARWEADLLPRATQVCLRRQGPAGLAILRQRHFARHPMLRPEQRLVSLPSLQSRRDLWAEAAETIRSSLYKLVGRPVVGI